jgi:hypothetical protein
VEVEVHEPRRDQAAAGVDLAPRAGQARTDRLDPTSAERDIDEIRPTTNAGIPYQEVHGALLITTARF